jgi:2-amino-4-hydroxy-6-hydroxymethyldihydropteridine diphosphokinase
MNTAFLLLGSNQGHRQELLHQACRWLQETVGSITRASSLYESEPWGFAAPNWFLNQVLEIHTQWPPEQLLSITQHIEKRLGRREKPAHERYASRPIDIDILFYNHQVMHTPALTLPHPRLHERRFTLLPLCELAPNLLHPVLHKTAADLLLQCPDTGIVRLLPGTVQH